MSSECLSLAIKSQGGYCFNMTALEAQWTPAKHFILGDDPQLRLYAEAAVWLKKIELFRKGEDERSKELIARVQRNDRKRRNR